MWAIVLAHEAAMNDDARGTQQRDPYRLWTAQEVAQMLGVCTETVYRLHRHKKLCALNDIRTLRFPDAAVVAFLKRTDKE